MSNKVVHFEITSKDPESSIKFYTEVFGWKITKWDGPVDYWLVDTGDPEKPGIGGAIMQEGDVKGTVNTIDVENIHKAIKSIGDNGGEIVRDIQTIPGVGYFVYATDPNGELFGLMQSDPEAK